jgi:GMP synthase (glutamine-hydrolysing)
LGIPTLGICYGAQLLALDLGGRVDQTGAGEYGKVTMRTNEGALFATLPEDQTAWMSHRDTVVEPPFGARIVATSEHTPVAAFEDEDGNSTACSSTRSCHPARQAVPRLPPDVAGAAPSWTPAAVIENRSANPSRSG